MDREGQGPLVERNPDGTFTKETLRRAMKAFKKRLKLARLCDESRLGHDAASKGRRSGICAIQPPEQYPPQVWEALVEKGRLRRAAPGLYEEVPVA
ncbi:MAG: hypothetical protein Fur0037_29200 [Planctomycetota bacterium]